MPEVEYRSDLRSSFAAVFLGSNKRRGGKTMPTLDINAIGNTLLGGFAVILAVLWVFIHLNAVRDLRKSSAGKIH